MNCSGPGFALHSDIVMPYISHYGTPEQIEKFIPNMTAGKCIGAIAMTEPGAGRYDKCPKILNTLFLTFLAIILLYMQLFFRILSEMAKVQSLILVCAVCIFHFVRNFGV